MSYRVRPMILALVAIGFISASAPAAWAQTISQPNGNANFRTTFFGQSFVATVTGEVTQISVRPREVRATTLYVYDRIDTGQFNGPGTPVSQQPVVLADQGSNAAGFQTFVLASPLPVTAGQVYSFAFGNADLAHSTANPYAGGTYFTSGQSPNGPGDLAFEVVQQVIVPVPTLSGWAMILLALALAGGAVIQVQRRVRPA